MYVFVKSKIERNLLQTLSLDFINCPEIYLLGAFIKHERRRKEKSKGTNTEFNCKRITIGRKRQTHTQRTWFPLPGMRNMS